MLDYLQSWVWAGDGIIKAAGCTFRVSALPLVCGIDGELLTLGDCIEGQHVLRMIVLASSILFLLPSATCNIAVFAMTA